MTDIFYKRLCTRTNLFAAWRHVRSRAFKSPVRDIRNAAEEFDVHAFSNIQSIQSKLVAGTFKFPPAEGILKDKAKRERQGKLPRPIVIGDIKSRIVQRALLQCLQPDEDDQLSKLIGQIREVNNSTINFGGTPYGGVPKAIYRVTSLMDTGHTVFYKSDIGSFFTKVPHVVVLSFLLAQLKDEKFVEIFRAGLNVQLKNAEQLGEYLNLFPENDFGVPQGSSLSAFAGNVFLHDVDSKFQDLEGVGLIRYVDDVVLLGKSNELLQKAKSIFSKELRRKGLSLYDPAAAPDKAAEGHVRNGFDYLGCALHQKHIEPSQQARASLLKKVDSEISEARLNIQKFMTSAHEARKKESTFSQAIAEIDNIVRGWANSFRFVNNRLIFAQLDRQIIRKISDFQIWASRLKPSGDSQKARILGVFQTHDVEFKPLKDFLIPHPKKKVLPQISRRPARHIEQIAASRLNSDHDYNPIYPLLPRALS